MYNMNNIERMNSIRKLYNKLNVGGSKRKSPHREWSDLSIPKCQNGTYTSNNYK